VRSHGEFNIEVRVFNRGAVRSLEMSEDMSTETMRSLGKPECQESPIAARPLRQPKGQPGGISHSAKILRAMPNSFRDIWIFEKAPTSGSRSCLEPGIGIEEDAVVPSGPGTSVSPLLMDKQASQISAGRFQAN